MDTTTAWMLIAFFALSAGLITHSVNNTEYISSFWKYFMYLYSAFAWICVIVITIITIKIMYEL